MKPNNLKETIKYIGSRQHNLFTKMMTVNLYSAYGEQLVYKTKKKATYTEPQPWSFNHNNGQEPSAEYADSGV